MAQPQPVTDARRVAEVSRAVELLQTEDAALSPAARVTLAEAQVALGNEGEAKVNAEQAVREAPQIQISPNLRRILENPDVRVVAPQP